MSNNNTETVTVAPLKGGTRYRVGTRVILQKLGFVFEQKTGAIDEYSKDGLTAQLFHASNNNLSRAEISDGKGPVVEIKDGKLKIERTLARLIHGDEDKAKAWYMTDADTRALPPLGSGDALIKGDGDFTVPVVTEVKKVEEVVPEVKPVPKPASRRKAPAAKAG